jgi:phosphoribosylaminoimidazole carboxylase PurE protein
LPLRVLDTRTKHIDREIDMAFVSILMGSESDLPVMQETAALLKRFGVAHEMRISSAHRTPDATRAYVRDADARGCAIFVAAAGMAAHLAGAVAANTVRPVIGVPLDAGGLGGLDALLSTVQMPGGIPVASVAIGKAGARNAAYLALQILAINDATIAEKLEHDRDEAAANVAAANARLQSS